MTQQYIIRFNILFLFMLSIQGCNLKKHELAQRINTISGQDSKLYDHLSGRYLIIDGVDVSKANEDIVFACLRHYKEKFNHESVFNVRYREPVLKKLIYVDNIHHYVFSVPYADGSLITYAYSPTLKEIKYRFFIPTA